MNINIERPYGFMSKEDKKEFFSKIPIKIMINMFDYRLTQIVSVWDAGELYRIAMVDMDKAINLIRDKLINDSCGLIQYINIYDRYNNKIATEIHLRIVYNGYYIQAYVDEPLK